MSPPTSVDNFGITWGKWDKALAENWLVVAQIEDDLVRLSTGDYFANVNPTEVAKLQGSHHFATGIASAFIGSGSAGLISDVNASMDVDFANGVISNGNLSVSVADQLWSIGFDGLVHNGIVGLTANNGSLVDSSGLVSQSIDADLGGVFSGANGEAFVGGFDLLDQVNPINTVEGIFTIER